MYNAAKEEYIYAIAGGETMQIIDYLERAAGQANYCLGEALSL